MDPFTVARAQTRPLCVALSNFEKPPPDFPQRLHPHRSLCRPHTPHGLKIFLHLQGSSRIAQQHSMLR